MHNPSLATRLSTGCIQYLDDKGLFNVPLTPHIHNLFSTFQNGPTRSNNPDLIFLQHIWPLLNVLVGTLDDGGSINGAIPELPNLKCGGMNISTGPRPQGGISGHWQLQFGSRKA
jgi:hypothetical protein